MHKQPFILIVDDEISILKTLKESLEDDGFLVETLADASKLCTKIGELIPDLILLDIFMPNQNGLALLQQIKKEFPTQAVIMISGFGNIQIALQAIKNGAVDFIEKPLNLDEVLPKIHAVTTEIENKQSPPTQIYETHGFIGQSSYFLELMRQVELAAPYNFPILLQGKTGTGKLSLARFIHQKSTFLKNPFIEVDTFSLNEKSLQELFMPTTKTIYIPNIEILSLKLQKNLAILLQQYKGNIRCIASTTQSLWKQLQAKQFCSELFCALQTFPLEIPPLKNRAGDIPLLVQHFLMLANNEYKKNIKLTPASIRLLRNKSWDKNNITELKTTLNKLVLCTPTETTLLTHEDLLLILGEDELALIEEQQFTHFSSLKDATGAFEKKFILYLLQKNFYNIQKVADRLHVTPLTLENTINRLNIELDA